MFQGTTGRLTQGSSSASTDAPVLAMSTIAALLELAYLEVHSLLADEALPLFKEFCCLEEVGGAHEAKGGGIHADRMGFDPADCPAG